MVSEYKFPFGTTNLEVKTTKELNSKLLDGIEVLIKDFYFELNHNNHNSSSNKFNSAQSEIPIFVTQEYIDFLELNLDYEKRFTDVFNPFSVSNKELSDSLTINKDDGYVIKHKEITFETSTLRSAFIIDLLKEYLLENKVEIFFIGINDLVIAKGSVGWNVKLDDVKFPLSEQSALLVNVKKPYLKNKHKFGAINNELNYASIVITGESCAFLKIISLLFVDILLKTEAHKFSQEWGVRIIFFDEQNNILHSA